MRNFWIQSEHIIATWYADVTPLLDTPEKLLGLMRRVCEESARTQMVLPIDYDPLATIERRWESEHAVEVFRTMRTVKCESQLAWYSASDEVVEGRIADLGELLESLQPTPNSIDDYNRYPGYPPVRLMGDQVRYVGRTPSPRPPYGETFNIALYSDIWFPYVSGMAHPSRDFERFFDNRELAMRHTPRINDLLASVGRLVTDAGGRWFMGSDEAAAMYRPWLSEAGIRLEGPSPALMPPALVDVEWPDLDA